MHSTLPKWCGFLPLATTESHPHAQFRRDTENPMRRFINILNIFINLFIYHISMLYCPTQPSLLCWGDISMGIEFTEMWKFLFDLNQVANLNFLHPINRTWFSCCLQPLWRMLLLQNAVIWEENKLIFCIFRSKEDGEKRRAPEGTNV